MLNIIINYIGTVINAASAIIYGRIILKERIKSSKKNAIIATIFVATVLQLLFYLKIKVFKTLVGFLLYLLLFKVIYKKDNVQNFLLTLFYFIVEIISDMLVIKILVNIVGEEVFYNNLSGSIISNIVILLPFIIVTFLLKNIINKILNIKIKNGLIILSFLDLSCLIFIFYSTYNYGTNKIDNLFGMLCLIVMVSLIFNSIIQAYKSNRLAEEYDNLLTFIKKYEVEIDNQRTIRHESKNQLLTIKAKVIDKDKDSEIIKYIDEILKETNQVVKHSEYAKLKYLPSNGLRGLFYYKVSLAQDKKINVQINISKNLEKSFLTKLNSQIFNQLCKVIGIYLDNAIESSEVSEEKIMGIEILNNESEVEFIISNSYNPKLKKVGNSTKGIGRGHGLLLANGIINNNKALKCITEISNNIYTQKITIKKE